MSTLFRCRPHNRAIALFRARAENSASTHYSSAAERITARAAIPPDRKEYAVDGETT